MERLITVGQVDANGRRLRTLQIPESAISFARTHGWWVFEDFEATYRLDAPHEATSQADGFSDAPD